MVKLKDMVGIKNNKLTGIKQVDSNKHGQAMWLFICDCGKECIVSAYAVRQGHTKSCGCANFVFNTAQEALASEIFLSRYSDGDITFEQFYKLIQNNCYYCGSKPINKAIYRGRKNLKRAGEYLLYNGLDRINSSLPHNLNNIVSCCYWCNIMKLDHSQEDFLQHIKDIYHYSCKNV